MPPDNKPAKSTRHGVSRKWNSSLTIAAREAVPPAVMVDWLLAIMEGYGTAVLQRDARVEGGWKVIRPENGAESTDQQKQWAWLQWRLAGYGQPVQSIALDADLRQHMQLDVELAPEKVRGELDYQTREALVAALQASLSSKQKPLELGGASPHLEPVEAELVEDDDA